MKIAFVTFAGLPGLSADDLLAVEELLVRADLNDPKVKAAVEAVRKSRSQPDTSAGRRAGHHHGARSPALPVVWVMLFSAAEYGTRDRRRKTAKKVKPSTAALMLPPSMKPVLTLV